MVTGAGALHYPNTMILRVYFRPTLSSQCLAENRVFFWEIAVKIPSQETYSGKSNLQNHSDNPISENALWEI